MRIRNKILLGFSAIILLTLLVSGFALHQLQTISKDATTIYNHPLVVSNTVRDIAAAINTMHRDMIVVVLEDDTVQPKATIEEIRQKEQEILNLICILRERYLGDTSDVEQFHRLFLAWEPIRNEVISLKNRNMHLVAAEITRTRGAEHVELLLDNLHNISGFARHKADELYYETLKAEKESWNILLLVSVGILLVSILLTVILSASISRPIRRFVKELQAVFLTTDIDTSSCSESELLQITADEIKRNRQQLAEKEKELTALNAELEEKVRMRTMELDEQNRKLQTQIEERAQIEEELQASNEELQNEINQRAAIGEDLRASNDQLVSEMENRRKSEKMILSERNFSNAILNSMPGIFYMYDKDGILVKWNKNFPETTGYQPDELRNKSALDFFPEEHRELVAKRIGAVYEEGFKSVKADLLTKSGKKIPYYFTGTKIIYEGREYLVGHGSDLSEVKQAREEVDNFFKVTLDLMCIAGMDGYFRKLNPSWEKVLGYSVQELMENHFSYFIHPDDQPLAQEAMVKLLNGHQLVNFISRFKTKSNGYRWLKWNTAPHGDALYAAATDITTMIETEQELKKLLVDLEITNQELERFAYVASHDLQEPLRMVTSFLQLIEKRYNDKLDNDGREFIAYAVDGANRMKKLINDLLKYSRVGTRGKLFEPVDLNDTLNRSLTILNQDIEANHVIFKVDKLPTVEADESQMLQLLLNLISNAIKFRSEHPPEINIRVKEENNAWKFSFRDNGIGIDEQFFDRIFIIFQRLHGKDKYHGTGIGLAICKKIVERHNGHISVNSEVDKGTEFIFTIQKNLSRLNNRRNS